jgi:hypothetical protein
MKYTKKGVSFAFILLFLLIPFVYAQQVVQVQQEQAPVKKSFLSNAFGFLKSPIFWWIVIGLAIIIAIVIGLFFLVRWLVKFLKSRNDIFWRLKSERMKLAKIQRRYNSKAWFKVYKNTPIRLVKKENGHLFVSQPIAYHRGDYTTHEGNVVICMNLRDNKKFFIFPITDLLVIPNKEKVKITRKNDKGKIEIITLDNLPQAKDIVQFNENEILIYADSLSNVGMFYVPVLKTKDGKIIDLSLPVYQSLREVVLGDYLYEQTDEFTKIAKKSMDINPNLRYATKLGDSSQSIEVPQETK